MLTDWFPWRKRWPHISSEEIQKRARLLVIDDQDFPYAVLFHRDGYNVDTWHDVERLALRLSITSSVEAVYDPYLDDKGLSTLLILLRLSNSADPNLRLITGSDGARRLTPHFAAAVFAEVGCVGGKIRGTTSARPHRRFMLLSGGKSLILGMSLNDIDKDEAANVEDSIDDRPFFEDEWKNATPT